MIQPRANLTLNIKLNRIFFVEQFMYSNMKAVAY